MAAAASVVAASALARAADRPVTWGIATEPPACGDGRLVAEVHLACDAMDGACTVGGEPLDRRAVLRCPPGPTWTLDVYDAAGELLWSEPLEGEGDRVHRAALWIARTRADAIAPSPDAPGISPAPAAPPAPAPVAVALPAPAAPPPAQDRVSAPRPAQSRWGLLASERGVLGSGFGPTVGGRVGAAYALATGVTVEANVGGEHGLESPGGFTLSALRLGGALALGAPWSRGPLGAVVEGGAVMGTVSAPDGQSPASQQFWHAFGRAGAVVAFDATRSLRPLAELSLLAQSAPVQVVGANGAVTTSPSLCVALDVGVDRVCVHVVLNHWRWWRRWLRRFELSDATEEPDCSATPSQLVVERERIVRLYACLERLAPDKRVILTLYDLEELPASRVAEILDCPEATVRSRLRQARAELAALLAREPAFEESRP